MDQLHLHRERHFQLLRHDAVRCARNHRTPGDLLRLLIHAQAETRVTLRAFLPSMHRYCNRIMDAKY